MSVLVIGPEEERAIHNAIRRARERPTPWEALKAVADATTTPTLMLADRKPGVEAIREKYPSQHLMLGTYRASISFEEQPAGLMRHLSVSSHMPHRMPGPHVMGMICEAFGFSKKLCTAMGKPRATVFVPDRPMRVWAEEFDPGQMAINVVELEP